MEGEERQADTRVVCIYCAGLGQNKGEDCDRCGGTGLVEPEPPAARRTGAAEQERPHADDEGDHEPGSATGDEDPPRRRRRRKVDPGFDVDDKPAEHAPRKQRQAKLCRDPDCLDHAAARGAARKCVVTERAIYPRMDERTAAMLASGILNAISMGVSVVADAPVSAPTKAEAERLAGPLAPIVQRYLGSLGAHAEILVLVTILIAYGRDRWKEAQRVKESKPAPVLRVVANEGAE